ncbi:MAG TPA: helix-turn-helix domain-containing protein [Ktedonobacteraceae bacterium]|jgi:excisionase family DNA binding protein|nr:helix-turn-helix domain-containing protein [Ktedonobacteraceae bacterium]
MSDDQPHSEKMISAKQVGEMLGFSAKTVIRMVEAGVLPGYKMNFVWRFKRSEIEEYIRSRRYHPQSEDQ